MEEKDYIALPQKFAVGDNDVYSGGYLNIRDLRFRSFFANGQTEEFVIDQSQPDASHYKPVALGGNYREWDISSEGEINGVKYRLAGKINVEKGSIVVNGTYGDQAIEHYTLDYVPFNVA